MSSTRASAANDNATPLRVTVSDAYLPDIPEANAAELQALFKFQTLTKCEGEPTYDKTVEIRDQAIRNALAVKSPFGGGKHGHMGMIMPETTYLQVAGEVWQVPDSGGVYPRIPANATTETAKKTIIAKFIQKEAGIKRAEVMTELLRNQLLDAFDEEYYMELKERIYGYDRVEPKDILTHIFEHYARIDDEIIFQNKRTFEAAPDMSKPIDVYFCKQEDCQIIATDGGIPISEAEMVLVLQQHMGESGLVGSAYTKWRSKPAEERTWISAKKFFRSALRDAQARNKIEGGEREYAANATVRHATNSCDADAFLDKYEEAFDNLADRKSVV